MVRWHTQCEFLTINTISIKVINWNGFSTTIHCNLKLVWYEILIKCYENLCYDYIIIVYNLKCKHSWYIFNVFFWILFKI